MKRFAVFALAAWCILAPGNATQAQSIKERSLADTQATTTARKALSTPVQTTPAQQPGAVVQPVPVPRTAATPPPASPGQTAQPAARPAGQQTAPAPQPAGQAAQPAPAANAAPGQAVQPAPAAQPAAGQPVPPASAPPGQPAGQPAAAGQAAPAPAPGGTPINGSTSVSPPPSPPPAKPANTYSRDEINREVMGFFESGSRGLAQIVAKAFREQGQPNGFIKGGEGGGALFLGFRYGSGTLYLKGFPPVKVFWQSPSLGIDLGVNVGKVFTLVYNMRDPVQIFQRFPGVNGSIYLIGGFGMNYQRSGPITLAPIRFGVGLRLGASVAYQHYTRTKSINPF